MVNLDKYIAFAVDEKNIASRLYQGSKPIVAYEKISWWETSAFHLALQIAVGITFLTFLIVSVVSFFLRRKSDRD